MSEDTKVVIVSLILMALVGFMIGLQVPSAQDAHVRTQGIDSAP